jgi:prevent-host-death family protein
MHTVTLAEAQAHLPELIAETQQGEEVVITENDRPVARLAAADGWPLFGLLKGKMTIAADFDEPLEEFRPYVE